MGSSITHFTEVETEAQRSQVPCHTVTYGTSYTSGAKRPPKSSRLNMFLARRSGAEQSMAGGLPLSPAWATTPKGAISHLAGRETGYPALLPPQQVPSLSQTHLLLRISQQSPYRAPYPDLLPPSLQSCHFPCLKPPGALQYPVLSLQSGLLTT